MSSPSIGALTSFTGLQKAAILLLSLGPASSAALLKLMPEDEVDIISAAIAKLDVVTPQDAESIIQEYQASTAAHALIVSGGLESARPMLVEAYGREQATRIVDRVAKTLDRDAADFSSLRRVDSQQLANFIQDEHPQTIALVLSHLDSIQAAALICALPVEIRADVATRMAGLEQISPEAVRTIAAVIGQKLKNFGELSREACGGVRAVADMFNRLDPTNCNILMGAVEKEDPVLFESVRRLMFVFEDLAGLDALGVKELLGRVDRKVLVVALKGANDTLQRHFMAGMSQSGAEMLKEDIAALGAVKIKDVDAAQQEIITEARELEKAGTISLKNSPAELYIN